MDEQDKQELKDGLREARSILVNPWFGIMTIRGKILFCVLGFFLVFIVKMYIEAPEAAGTTGAGIFFIVVFGGWIFYIEKRHRERVLLKQFIGERKRGDDRQKRLEREVAHMKFLLGKLNSDAPNSKASKTGFTGRITTEQQALEVFDISKPYTAKDIKKRRNQLLQKIHPDTGGSNMLVRLVNDAYDILKGRA